jgi:hypothetical protein
MRAGHEGNRPDPSRANVDLSVWRTPVLDRLHIRNVGRMLVTGATVLGSAVTGATGARERSLERFAPETTRSVRIDLRDRKAVHAVEVLPLTLIIDTAGSRRETP